MQNLNINVQELSYISLFRMNVPDQLEPSRRLWEALQGWSSMRYNTTIWFVAALSLIVDVRTYVRTHLRTNIFAGFIRSSLRRWPKNSAQLENQPQICKPKCNGKIWLAENWVAFLSYRILQKKIQLRGLLVSWHKQFPAFGTLNNAQMLTMQ